MSPAALQDAPFAAPISQAVPGTASPQAALAPPPGAQAPPLPDAPWAQPEPQIAHGPLQAIEAGFQSSATGLWWRHKLPDLVLDPANSHWWERVLAGGAQVGAELPLMIGGSAAGGAAGGAVAGPVGALVGGGAGMFALPTAVRETLMHAYASGEIKTPDEFWAAMKDVLEKTGKSAVVGAATAGVGSMVARGVGAAIAPSIGESIGVKAATRVIGGTQLAAEIGTMTATPAALEGQMPHLQDFVDAAILIGGMHVTNVTVAKLMRIYARTGKQPAEIVAQAKTDPALAQDLVTPTEPVPGAADMGPISESPVYKAVKDQLDALGRGTPEQRDAQAQLQAAFYRTMAARTGTTEEALYAAKPVTVTGEPPPAGAFGQEPAGRPSDLTLEHPEMQQILKGMAEGELGWAQIGGRHQGGPLGVPNFTKWIPRADWWMARPDKRMNEPKMREAVRKALAGEKLKPAEQRAVDFMVQVANDRIAASQDMGTERFNLVSRELTRERVEPTTTNVVDTNAVARATERDADAVERAAMQHADDDAAFMREIRRINGEEQPSALAPEGSQESAAPPAQRPGAAPERQAEVVRRTVAGGAPRAGWADATRIRRAGGPLEVHRGADRAISTGDFADEALGAASGNPSSGLGVWFTPSLAEARTYGSPQSFHLDVRNPKVIKVEDLPGFESVKDAVAYREGLKAQGYDGIVITAKHLGGKTHVVAFDPEQVIHSENQAAYFQQVKSTFYSVLAQRIDEAKMKEAPAKGWKDYVRGLASKGVKADEVKWSGIEDWLDAQEGKVSKQAVQEFLRNNGVRVEEITRGGPGERTLDDPEIKGAVDRLRAENIVLDQSPDGMFWAVVDMRPDAPFQGELFVDPKELKQLFGEDNFTLEETRNGWKVWLNPDRPNQPKRYATTLPADLTEEGAAAEARVQVRDALKIPEAEQQNYQDALDALNYMNSAPREVQTKFGGYVLPGGENYRELLLTLPEESKPREYKITEEPHGRFAVRNAQTGAMILPSYATRQEAERELETLRITAPRSYAGNFTAGHWDEPNVLAHIRFNERYSEDGAKTLFIEEIQSDWAQKGKKQGFSEPVPPQLEQRANALQLEKENAFEEAIRVADENSGPAGFPTGVSMLGDLDRRVRGGGFDIEHAMQNWKDRVLSDSGYEIPEPAWQAMKNWVRANNEYELAARDLLAAETRAGRGIPAAPFVGKTDAWVALVMKRMIRYAAENGMDQVAWTTGEQQVSRWTSALRKHVDVIEWKKTPEGVQLIGYKGRGQGRVEELRSEIQQIDNEQARIGAEAPPGGFDQQTGARIDYLTARRRSLEREMQNARQKVVDTTEKETTLSDAIGKTMAKQILEDPNQTGTIEGENIRVDDTGMASFYDRIVPNVANDVLKKLGGGKVKQIELDTSAKGAGLPPLRPFERADEYSYAGAEPFPNGDRPMITSVTLLIDNRPAEMEMIVAGNGVQLSDGANDTYVPWEKLDGAPRTAADANAQIKRMWENPESIFWNSDALTTNTPAGMRPVTEPQPQMGFDVTPEMKAKALEGQPMFAGDKRGYFAPDTRTMGLMATADASTFIHESGHQFLEMAIELAAEPNAPASLKADMGETMKWMGIPTLEDWGRMTVEQRRPFHEQWADAFTQYVASGRAPSNALGGAFERFKAWLLDLYQAFTGRGNQVSPEIRKVMDRMLATDEEIQHGTPPMYAQDAVDQRARSIVPGVEAGKAAESPFAAKLPQAAGEPSLPGHVNYNRINGTVEAKLAAARLAELYQAKIETQRRGTVSNEQTANEAAQILSDTLGGADKRLLMPREPGTAAGAAEILARKAMVEGALEDMMKVGEAFRAKGRAADANETLDYLASIERTSLIMSEFLGARAEVGRALQILKTTLDAAERAKQIQQLIETYGGEPTKLAEMMKEIETPAGAAKWAKDTAAVSSQAAKLLDDVSAALEQNSADPQKLDRALEDLQNRRQARPTRDLTRLGVQAVRDAIAKNRRNPEKLKALVEQLKTPEGARAFAEEQLRPTLWDKLVEGWKAGILSGPITHMANIVGNTSYAGMHPVIDAVASVIGTMRGASVGDRMSLWEPVGRVLGLLQGTRDGLLLGVEAMMHEDAVDPTKGEAYRHAIEGKKGEIIRLPFRALGAADRVFETMNNRGELYALATRQAVEEGLSPLTREFRERVVTIVQNPTVDMIESAQKAAKRYTFNVPLGPKGKAVQNLVRTWHLEWAVPFIRTPANIALELGRMTPLAPIVKEWSDAFRAGGIARDRAIAELAVGTGIMALTAGWAFGGNISGNGPPEPGSKRVKRGAGWQPYSVLIDGKWYSYSRIQPVGTLMGLAADMAEIWDHMTPEEQGQIPKMISIAFANAVTNQTFLQGITMITNAMSDPTRFMPRMLRNLVASGVPNIIAQPTSMADPYARQVQSVLDAIRNRIPGQRQQLARQVDVWGQPIPSWEHVLGVMPSSVTTQSLDKVKTEAERLGIQAPGVPKRVHVGRGTGKLGETDITPQQQEKYGLVAGQIAYSVMAPLVNSPAWDNLPPLVQRRAYAHAFLIGSRMAAFEALPPEQRIPILNEITQRITQELVPLEPKQ
ncbi:MAG TPA: hypothetical protein VF151_10890 [Gemmatimonadales bacterium]